MKLPKVMQKAHHDCGLAAVECVLKFHGRTMPRDEIPATPIDGTDPRTIESFCRSIGLRVVSGEMSIDDLKYFTASDRPVIAVLQNHYVVVGSVKRGVVIYQDPKHGLSSESCKAFVERWKDMDRLGACYNQFGVCVW